MSGSISNVVEAAGIEPHAFRDFDLGGDVPRSCRHVFMIAGESRKVGSGGVTPHSTIEPSTNPLTV